MMLSNGLAVRIGDKLFKFAPGFLLGSLKGYIAFLLERWGNNSFNFHAKIYAESAMIYFESSIPPARILS